MRQAIICVWQIEPPQESIFFQAFSALIESFWIIEVAPYGLSKTHTNIWNKIPCSRFQLEIQVQLPNPETQNHSCLRKINAFVLSDEDFIKTWKQKLSWDFLQKRLFIIPWYAHSCAYQGVINNRCFRKFGMMTVRRMHMSSTNLR